MPKDPQTASPIAPTMAEAVGFNDRRVAADDRGAPQQGDLVEKGHAKYPMADPSAGTATVRPHALEAGSARFRVHPPSTMPNVPEAAATQANGRIVAPSAAVHYEKDYSPDVEAAFDDGPVITDAPPGAHRLRGFTARNG